jgi:hypothetical protein
MVLFEFRDFVGRRGNVVDALLGEWGDQVRAGFDDLLNYLANTPMGQWTRPQTDKLHGKHRELREFRVRVQRVKYRLYGFDGPDPRQITLVGGLRKTGGSAEERQAQDQALARMRAVQAGDAGTADHV